MANVPQDTEITLGTGRMLALFFALVVICAGVVGALLAFLWFNAHPAEIFMGDVGSLALGGGLGVVAVLLKQEILLLFIGGVFVIEAISVILQVGSFKMRGRKYTGRQRIAPSWITTVYIFQ